MDTVATITEDTYRQCNTVQRRVHQEIVRNCFLKRCQESAWLLESRHWWTTWYVGRNISKPHWNCDYCTHLVLLSAPFNFIQEFNLVSIKEARRSVTMSRSMKRLSWITVRAQNLEFQPFHWHIDLSSSFYQQHFHPWVGLSLPNNSLNG